MPRVHIYNPVMRIRGRWTKNLYFTWQISLHQYSIKSRDNSGAFWSETFSWEITTQRARDIHTMTEIQTLIRISPKFTFTCAERHMHSENAAIVSYYTGRDPCPTWQPIKAIVTDTDGFIWKVGECEWGESSGERKRYSNLYLNGEIEATSRISFPHYRS